MCYYDKYKIIDEEIFELIKKQSENNKLLIREIFLSYFNEAEALIIKIHNCMEDANYNCEEAKSTIQSLFNISKTVGALRLKNISKDIEEYLKIKDKKNCYKLSKQLIPTYNEFKETINKMTC